LVPVGLPTMAQDDLTLDSLHTRFGDFYTVLE
jgi:hypothetical protein